MKELKNRDYKWRLRRILAAAAFAAHTGSVFAGYTSPPVTLEGVIQSTGSILVDLDSSVSVTAPFNCSNWSGATVGSHRGYINPVTSDVAKNQLAIILTALATGRSIRFSSSACYSSTGLPLIDNVWITD